MTSLAIEELADEIFNYENVQMWLTNIEILAGIGQHEEVIIELRKLQNYMDKIQNEIIVRQKYGMDRTSKLC